MVSSQARRDQVALAMERGHSQRQACELIELPRSILKYRALRIERDAPVLAAMRRIAATYPRYGYRRVRIFLRREGHAMSPERAYRLWRAAGLQLPRRRPRRRIASDITAASSAGDHREPSMGLRLRLRCLRQRADAQMPDRDRRIHPRMPGDRRRGQPLGPCHRCTHAADQRTWRTSLPALR